jgi:hypothetical protein
MKLINNIYIADKGKAFKRFYDGFNKIESDILYPSLILGKILIDSEGNKLETPIDDRIQYYAEVEIPKENNKKHSR